MKNRYKNSSNKSIIKQVFANTIARINSNIENFVINNEFIFTLSY